MELCPCATWNTFGPTCIVSQNVHNAFSPSIVNMNLWLEQMVEIMVRIPALSVGRVKVKNKGL